MRPELTHLLEGLSTQHRKVTHQSKHHQLVRLTQQLWLLIGQDLVVDVVVPLRLELEDNPGFLQEI